MNRRVPAATPCLVLVLLAAPLLALDRKEATFDANGVEIRYFTQGQGDPVILVHGFTADAERNWVMPGIFDRLAEEFRVIALDVRGHGKSGKPHDPAQYGMEMVHDVVRLMDHLELERAHVVGYSMGGFITMELLTQAPERLLSATVGGAGWRPEDDRPDPLMETIADSLEAGTGILPLLEALQPPGQETPPPEQIAMMNDMVMSTNDPEALAAVIRGLDGLAVTEEQLTANQVPTLAVVGSLDPLKAGVDAMDGVMSDLSVVVIDGADHMTALLDPRFSQQLAAAIREFLIASCNCA